MMVVKHEEPRLKTVPSHQAVALSSHLTIILVQPAFPLTCCSS